MVGPIMNNTCATNNAMTNDAVLVTAVTPTVGNVRGNRMQQPAHAGNALNNNNNESQTGSKDGGRIGRVPRPRNGENGEPSTASTARNRRSQKDKAPLVPLSSTPLPEEDAPPGLTHHTLAPPGIVVVNSMEQAKWMGKRPEDFWFVPGATPLAGPAPGLSGGAPGLELDNVQLQLSATEMDKIMNELWVFINNIPDDADEDHVKSALAYVRRTAGFLLTNGSDLGMSAARRAKFLDFCSGTNEFGEDEINVLQLKALNVQEWVDICQGFMWDNIPGRGEYLAVRHKLQEGCFTVNAVGMWCCTFKGKPLSYHTDSALMQLIEYYIAEEPEVIQLSLADIVPEPQVPEPQVRLALAEMLLL